MYIEHTNNKAGAQHREEQYHSIPRQGKEGRRERDKQKD